MRLDDLLRDGEPQPTPAPRRRAGLVDLVEALEDPGLVAGRDERARIVHGNVAKASGSLADGREHLRPRRDGHDTGREGDRAAARGVLEGVVEQVVDGPLY